MDTQQRSGFRRHAVVEHVPGARHAFGVDGWNQPGPSRVDSRHSADLCDAGWGEQAVDHQTISA